MTPVRNYVLPGFFLFFFRWVSVAFSIFLVAFPVISLEKTKQNKNPARRLSVGAWATPCQKFISNCVKLGGALPIFCSDIALLAGPARTNKLCCSDTATTRTVFLCAPRIKSPDAHVQCTAGHFTTAVLEASTISTVGLGFESRSVSVFTLCCFTAVLYC